MFVVIIVAIIVLFGFSGVCAEHEPPQNYRCEHERRIAAGLFVTLFGMQNVHHSYFILFFVFRLRNDFNKIYHTLCFSLHSARSFQLFFAVIFVGCTNNLHSSFIA